MTRKFGVLGFPGYYIYCIYIYINIYIYYDYIHIYDATLHAPFSDPDGLPKKDPKSAVPAVPTQAKAAWMRRDEITQWSSHENRGIWPSTIGGFTVQPWKIRISHDFSVCLACLTIGFGDFPKWSGKSQTDGFNTKTVQLWIIWGYLYVRNPQFFVWVVIWVRFVDQSWNHRCCCHFHCNYSYTIWIFNIAMENGPFTDDFPIKTSIYHGFSIAMLNNQMVGVLQFWPEPLLCNEHFSMTYHCSLSVKMGPNMA